MEKHSYAKNAKLRKLTYYALQLAVLK